uniref:S-protein homolog n=1 Tax=Glycine max TaxID=3847 RepID=C6SXI5_SOYBN|nr:unknown [Glycine max]
MRKTMCRSIHHVSLLFLLTMCLLINADCSESSSLNRSAIPSNYHFSSNDTNINILFLSIASGMSPNDPPVFFFYNYGETRIYLHPGKPFTKLANFDHKVILMYWDVLCVIFYAYDPTMEGGHQKIYWLVKPDGVFHSWDNNNWEKRKTWNNQACN